MKARATAEVIRATCSAAQRWTSFELLLSEGAEEETDEDELEDEDDEVLNEPEESEEEEYDGEGEVYVGVTWELPAESDPLLELLRSYEE